MINPNRPTVLLIIFLMTVFAITLFHAGPNLNVQEKLTLSSITEASTSDKQNDAPPVSSIDKVADNKVANNQLSSNYKAIFQKDLFIGDSVTQGLTFYEFLDDSTVGAKLGLNLNTANDELDKVEMAKPANIFILLGENDLEYYPDNQQFINSYAKFIQAVKARAPHSNIYVQSILPVAAKVEAENPNLSNSRINELNAALGDMAAKEGAHYLNLASVLKDRDDLYQPDGIHFQAEFYSLWLNYLDKNVK